MDVLFSSLTLNLYHGNISTDFLCFDVYGPPMCAEDLTPGVLKL